MPKKSDLATYSPEEAAKRPVLYRPVVVQLVDRSDTLVKHFGARGTYVLLILALVLVPSAWGWAFSHLVR